eukprot:6376974-Prymnesium_polylepis.2
MDGTHSTAAPPTQAQRERGRENCREQAKMQGDCDDEPKLVRNPSATSGTSVASRLACFDVRSSAPSLLQSGKGDELPDGPAHTFTLASP